MVKCDKCEEESIYSDTECNYCRKHLLEYKKIDENYEKFYDWMKGDKAIITHNDTIDNVISEYKDLIAELREAKKEKKTHIVIAINPKGIFVRLEGDKMLKEQFDIIESLLKSGD